MVKKFPLDVVLTLVTGVVMSPLEGLCTCAGHVLGHTVFAHELADRDFWTNIRRALYAQHPKLRHFEPVESDRADAKTYIESYMKRQRAKYGAMLPLTRGKNTRTEGPVESLRRIAPHMHIDVVVAPDGHEGSPR